MTENQWKFGGVLAVGVLAVWHFWLEKTAQKGATTKASIPSDVRSTLTPKQAEFAAPYYQTNPGIADKPEILNGSPRPFQNIYSVNVNADPLQFLTNKYIPMFGFVGVTAVGSM